MDDDAFDSVTGISEEEHTANSNEAEIELHRDILREEAASRELRRIRISPSFRIGVHIITAIERPWRLLLLPITLPWLMFQIGLEKIGKKPQLQPDEEIDNNKENRNCVVFFPTNGVGFGHFTRLFSLARRMKKLDDSLEIVFFTTMPTLHILYNEGYTTYHLSGRKKHQDMTASQWNAMVEEQLSLVFANHLPKAFIFDGAFPYRGMLNAIRNKTNTSKYWVRRGTFKKGTKIPVDSIVHFDHIVHPKDSLAMNPSEIDHGVNVITCSAMTLLDDDDLLPRSKARQRLGLGQTEKVAYVQLGAGRINDIDSEVRITVDELISQNYTIVIGESMLGERINIDVDNVKIIRDYPNSMYFNAFDISVQAGGYNSFHETRIFSLPTLFYPNMNTGMDDQLARCLVSEKEGWGVVVKDRNRKSIANGIHLLEKLKVKRLSSTQLNGALELAKEIVTMEEQ